MASKLGVARTSLSRELNTLKKEGLIDYDNKTFYLKEPFPFDVSI
jgi:Mn-dependent DtxR family transcriptional regulator